MGRNLAIRQDVEIFMTTQLRRRTNEILDAAQTESVMITRYGKPSFVVMSCEHFEVMQKLSGYTKFITETENPF